MTHQELLEWLRETDRQRLDVLWKHADDMRREHVGDAVHLRGLIEISSYCRRLCAYCGLRSPNRRIQRYRMNADEVLACARQAVELGMGTAVLQSGEDPTLDVHWVTDLVRRIKAETGLAVTLSLGERTPHELAAWRAAGADRYLLRFETSNRALFKRIHPPHASVATDRFSLLQDLRELGYEVGSGVMIGLPGQRYTDLARALELFGELDLDMIGVGPFVPHLQTPLGQADPGENAGDEQVSNDASTTHIVLALARLVCPLANIPSTTAVATLHGADGQMLALARGANVIMPNLTPVAYRAQYQIYPDKACYYDDSPAAVTKLSEQLAALGRTVGTGRGDSPNIHRRRAGNGRKEMNAKSSTLPGRTLGTEATNFIDAAKLSDLLTPVEPDPVEVRTIIAKSLAKEALSAAETAVLLRVRDPELIEETFAAARRLKCDVYGIRIVLFAPFYVGNLCVNDCRYCAFRRSNPGAVRRTLGLEEVRQQVQVLEGQGHKRLILVFGEHPKYTPEFIAECVREVYATKNGHGEIRRVNINAAPLDVAGYRVVHEAGIGTYQVFQETYHPETYARYHPADTQKGDYLYRLDASSRAQEAGIDDVGIGVLFGLYDWRFEVLGLVTHALHLQARFGVGPHTISFPRIQPAHGVDFDRRYEVADDEFKRVVATLRLAVPYTGMILTAREPAALRREVMAFGVSQIDAGTRIELGAYTEMQHPQCPQREQFQIADSRSLDEVMRELVEDNYIPSFCTACYRLGRTGEHFMEYAIPGFIRRFCTPNALTTLMEYLVDYASPETRASGQQLIAAELDKMEDQNLRKAVEERLNRIKTSDARDLYF